MIKTEANLTNTIGTLEREKFNHHDTNENLAKVEANLKATKNALEKEKVNVKNVKAELANEKSNVSKVSYHYIPKKEINFMSGSSHIQIGVHFYIT